MKIEYNTDMDALRKQILEAVNDTLPQKSFFRLYKSGKLLGRIQKNRIRLIKEKCFIARVPQRVFYGKIYEQDNCTFIKGFFFLQLKDLIFVFLFFAAMNVIQWLSYRQSFDPLTALLFCASVVVIISLVSMLVYRREERYVRAFLVSLQDKFI